MTGQELYENLELEKPWEGLTLSQQEFFENATRPIGYRVEHRAGRYVFMEARHYESNKQAYIGATVCELFKGSEYEVF